MSLLSLLPLPPTSGLSWAEERAETGPGKVDSGQAAPTGGTGISLRPMVNADSSNTNT